jgi:hypothetical protein
MIILPKNSGFQIELPLGDEVTDDPVEELARVEIGLTGLVGRHLAPALRPDGGPVGTADRCGAELAGHPFRRPRARGLATLDA